MNSQLSPKVVAIVIVLVLVVAVGAFAWVWHAPSATPDVTAVKGRPAAVGPSGPDAQQKKDIEEWKKQHPGATTRW